MKNPPAGSEGKVGEYCQNNTGLTSAAFAGNLEAGGAAKAGILPYIQMESRLDILKTPPNV